MEEAGLQLIAQNVNGYIGDMGKADNATEGFYKTLGNAGPAASGFQEVITGALRQVGAVMTDFAIQGAKAIGGFVKDSIGLAGDFQSGMQEFQAVAGQDIDTEGLEDFRDLFLQIGKELPVSTADVQQAAIELVKGGIDPATVAAGGLESSIKFAAAAMDGDLAGAAEISAKIVGGWADVTATAAEKADLMTRAQNTLTKAANASTVGVDDLSLGLFNVQGNAKLAGMGLDETVQAISLISPNFSSAATAGTSLNAMIARLQPTTKPAIAAMTDLGLYTEETGSAFYDAQGKFVGWDQAAQMLQDTTRDLTDAQKQSAFQTIFGMDAQGAAAELTRQGAAGWDRMTEALAKANGVQENAALKQQGFNTALDNAKGSVEALQITVGSYLLPVLTDLFNNVVSPAINTLTDMADALGGNDEAFARLGPTLQFFVTTLSDLSSYFTAVVEDGDYLNDFLTDLPGPIQGVVAGIGVLIASFDPLSGYIAAVVEDGDYLNDFLTDIPAPMRDVVQVVGEVISIFQNVGGESDALGSAIEDLNGIWTLAGKVVGDVMAGYEAVAKAVLPQIQQFIADHGEEISAFFKTTWDSIIDIVTLALELYDEIVPPTLQAIAGFITDHGEEIQRILGGAWTVITSLITGTLETIKGVFTVALDIINGDWDAAWTGMQGIADAQISAIQGAIGGFLDMIAGLFNTSMADIGKTWSNNWNMLVEIANKIGGRMVEAGSNIVGGIVSGIKNNASAIYDVLSDIADDAVNAFLSAIGAGSPAVEFMPAGEYAMQGVMEGMEAMLPALMDLIEQTGGSMINALTKNISKGGDVIRKMMDDLTKDIEDVGEQINDAIADSFGATASIDRQMAKNFDRMGDLGSDILAGYVQQSLAAEQKIAEGFADPAQGAKYFKMVSDNIFETAELKKKMDEETDLAAKERLKAQWILISRAQQAEMEQFKINQRGQTAPQDDIAAQIAALMQSNDVARNLPGVLQNAIIAQLTSLLGQLQTPAASQSMSANGWAAATTNTTNLNMPIYTNQSPGVLRSSMAIAGAALL